MKETVGTVISARTQWWLKINTKPVRTHAMDGAVFPAILKVRYTVNGQVYTKRKWIPAGERVPAVGSTLAVLYDPQKPGKAKLF